MPEKERVKFRREKIGFTFQSNNLVPYLNVRENVELMLRLNGRLDRAGKPRIEKCCCGWACRTGQKPAQPAFWRAAPAGGDRPLADPQSQRGPRR